MNPRRLLKLVLVGLLGASFVVIVGYYLLLESESGIAIFPQSHPVPAVTWRRTLPAAKASTGPAQFVLIISVDGMRPDAISEAKAATLLGLIEQGAVAAHAETIRPSITLPSHTAMLSGLDFRHHGVVWNNYRPGHLPHPTVFSLSAAAGYSTAMLFAKDKFHFLADPAQLHWIFGPDIPGVVPKLEDVTSPDYTETAAPAPASSSGKAAPNPDATSRTLTPAESGGRRLTTSAADIAQAFKDEWPRMKIQMTFIHFAEPDGAGHSKGWMTRAYLDAVLKVDAAIGVILDTLKASGDFPKTAVIVTADHGGFGRQHWLRSQPDAPENVTIPWICVGPGVRAGSVIPRPLRTMDTMPTALQFLGIPVPGGLDGRPVVEVLSDR